ncbi:TPA: tetratricopeptide repeat protein [Candidatus Woesearchaeota archaeon]|nr:tetratricopeptide repeat protein [Candidatus Woesearchaeota archaeon]
MRPAEAWYNAALKLDPQHVLALTNLGLVALEEGDYEKALQLQLKAVDASAEKAEIPDGLERSADKLEYAPAVVKLHLADTYAANEKPREAQATYKRVLKDHAGTEYEVDAFMGLAEVARSKDDQRQAVHYLDEARDVAEVLGMPTHQIDYNLGTLLQHQEFTESARASYEQAVAGAPFGEEPHYENRSSRLVEGFALNNLGVLATGEGDQEEARLYFEHAKQANPNDVLPVINVSNLQ